MAGEPTFLRNMADGTLDTNVLLDWVLERHPSRLALIERRFDHGDRFVVPDAALIELVYVLETSYKFSRPVIARNVLLYIDHPQLLCQADRLRRVVLHYLDCPSLSFTDCYLVATAEVDHTLPLWTFDRKLVNQSGGRAKLLK